MESRYDYVLLGGGTSCGYAARGIRELDKQGTVCIISADSEPPYDRPPFSKGYLRNDAMDVSDAHSNEESFYAENKIDVRLNAEATSIDLAEKSVTLADGTEVRYGQLLYALGSQPKRLGYPGSENAWTLRTAADGKRIKDSAKEGANAVIVGGGYIGTEVAASLASRGVKVTIIEAENKLGRFFPDSMSRAIQAQLESMGVTVVTGDSVAAFENGVTKTKNGKEFAADFLVEGVGVDRAPAVVLAAHRGLLETPRHARGRAAALDRRGRGAGVGGCIFHRDSLPLGRRSPCDPRASRLNRSRGAVTTAWPTTSTNSGAG